MTPISLALRFSFFFLNKERGLYLTPSRDLTDATYLTNQISKTATRSQAEAELRSRAPKIVSFISLDLRRFQQRLYGHPVES